MKNNNLESIENFSYLKDCVLNGTVMFHALIQVLKNTYIIFLVLAIPAYFSTSNLGMTTKAIVLFIIFSALAVLGLIYCYIKQWFYIKTAQERNSFFTMSSKEKGVVIGNVLKGSY